MQIRETLGRAFSSFLAVPSLVIAIFVLAAAGASILEQADADWLRPSRDYMTDHVFGNPEATSSLLGTIAAGVITITSITFSLLLLALQQSAGSLTHQVFDQFLRRRSNQLYFGFFVGMTLYALIMLATVNPPYNPVLGASIALVLVVVSLYLLLLLIYSTISQMRPTAIIQTIHDHTLSARQRQLELIGRTRRASTMTHARSIPVTASSDGFIGEIDLDAINDALRNASTPVEVVFRVSIGSYVAFQDTFAEVRSDRDEDGQQIAEHVGIATRFVRERNLDNDPAYGIEQLLTIAWRSISTSQQNPSPGIATINNLRDLLARWTKEEEAEPDETPLPIVYPDNVLERLFGAFESLAVVASEAMQAQTCAVLLRGIAMSFARLPLVERQRAEDLLLRTLPALGDHVLTADLDAALSELIGTLEGSGRHTTGAAIRAAQGDLASSIGKLNSRSTRVPSAGP